MSDGQIVVGWNDSRAAAGAADWARRHAAATGRTVLLDHEATGADSDNLSLAAGPVTDDAADPVAGLLSRSRQADILALGAPEHAHPRLLGGLTDHLAAASFCPVALISPQHALVNPANPVLVGVTDSPAGRLALRFAAAEAHRLGAALTVVHATEEFPATGPASQQSLDELRARWPDLPVTVFAPATAASGSDPADELVRRSADAQLLVIGCHHSSDPWSIRLGPVTDAVLRRALCPVITVARWHDATPA